MKKHSLKIVKIPSPKSPMYKQEFASQPQNYLRDIENKDKIKVEYLAKDYDPRTDLKALAGKKLVYPNPEPYIYTPSSEPNDARGAQEYVRPQSLSPPKPIGSHTVNNIHKYDFDIPVDSDDEDFRSVVAPPQLPQPPPPPSSSYTPPPLQQQQEQRAYYTPPPSTPTPPRVYTPPLPPSPIVSPIQSAHHTPVAEDRSYYDYNLGTPTNSANEQHTRLHNFLKTCDSDDEYGGEGQGDITYKKRHVVDPFKYMSEEQKDYVKLNNHHHPTPPSLNDLERAGEYKSTAQYLDSRQLDAMLTEQHHQHHQHQYPQESQEEHQHSSSTPPPQESPPVVEDDESIDDKKRDLLFNLDMLRKKYPKHASTIPPLNMQTPFSEIKHTYQLELRKLKIDNDVGNYRQYLMGGFMLIEYILGRFLRLDLEGFTQQQIINMQQYEIFLIEIGEKNYVPNGKKWPVELRLFFFILIQAGLFTVSKMILNKTGSNLLSMFNNVINPPPSNRNKRMKRPDIDIDNDL